jgi:8-oxo-dGTP diphosphatase
MWEFPGGKVDHSDGGVTRALMREVLEEVGLTLQAGDIQPATFWIHGSPKMLILLFSCTKYQGRAHGREGQQVVWASLEDLKSEKYELLDSHKSFARWVVERHTTLEREKQKL